MIDETVKLSRASDSAAEAEARATWRSRQGGPTSGSSFYERALSKHARRAPMSRLRFLSDPHWHRNLRRAIGHRCCDRRRQPADELADRHRSPMRETQIRGGADQDRVQAAALVGSALIFVGLGRSEDFAQHHVVTAAVAAGARPGLELLRGAAHRN